MPRVTRITAFPHRPLLIIRLRRATFVVFRLDYLSCALTVVSTVLIGRKYWGGFVLAGVNSVIFCVIGLKTSQLGFIPANVFCIALYAWNLREWRREDEGEKKSVGTTHAA
jgi:hypothetical protein